MFKLYFALALAATIQIGCSVSADGPKAPDFEALTNIPKDSGDSTGGTTTPAPLPSTKPAITYAEISNGRCLKSWNWESAVSLVCSNQGYFYFYNIVDKNPQTFALDMITSDGTAYRFNTKTSTSTGDNVYKISMSHSGGTTLSFDGIDFSSKNYSPKAGYVVYSGNSGSCSPVVAGTRQSCLKAVQNSQSYSDSIYIDSFGFPKDTVITVENCDLKAVESSLPYAKFSVTTEKCQIKGSTYKKGESVTFDLRIPSNYPALTSPY